MEKGNLRETGDGSVSYLSIVLLVAVVAAAFVASGVGSAVASSIEKAVCRVGQNDCVPTGGRPVAVPAVAPTSPAPKVPTGGGGANKILKLKDRKALLAPPGESPPPEFDPEYWNKQFEAQFKAARYYEGIAKADIAGWHEPSGKPFLEWQLKAGFTTRWRIGTGNDYDKAKREIILDVMTPPHEREATRQRALADLVEPPKKKGLDANDVSREEYIEQSVNHLADFYNAQNGYLIASTYARIMRANLPEIKGTPPYLETYVTAFKKATNDSLSLTDEERRLGGEAGRKAVLDAVTQLNSERLGNEWDAAQKAPKRSAKCLWLWRCS